jgi:hypothetical protein
LQLANKKASQNSVVDVNQFWEEMCLRFMVSVWIQVAIEKIIEKFVRTAIVFLHSIH